MLIVCCTIILKVFLIVIIDFPILNCMIHYIVCNDKRQLLHNYVGENYFSCCCLPTPLTLVCGWNPIIPLLVHQPAYPSIWQAAPSLQWDMPTNPGVTIWCVCGCSSRDGVCRVCGFCRGVIVVIEVICHRLCVSILCLF